MNLRYLSVDRIIWLLTVAFISSTFVLYSWTAGNIVLLVLAAAIFFLYAAKKNWKIPVSIGSYHLLVFFFALYCAITAIWAWEPRRSVQMGITIFEILVCMSLLYAYYEELDSVDALLRAIMWSGYIVSVYTLYSYRQDIGRIFLDSIRMDNGFNMSSLYVGRNRMCLVRMH